MPGQRLNFLSRVGALFSKRERGGAASRLPELQRAIGYRFRDPSVLVRALVHRSYTSNDRESMAPDQASNERLEFLGDAVLSLVVNEYLFRKYPEKREGALTKMKSVIVSKAILAHYAKRSDLGNTAETRAR